MFPYLYISPRLGQSTEEPSFHLIIPLILPEHQRYYYYNFYPFYLAKINNTFNSSPPLQISKK